MIKIIKKKIFSHIFLFMLLFFLFLTTVIFPLHMK